MMPFSGVRSSWLMLARNSLLARLASSARNLASCLVLVWARSESSRAALLQAADGACCRASSFSPPAPPPGSLMRGDVGGSHHQPGLGGAPLGDLSSQRPSTSLHLAQAGLALGVGDGRPGRARASCTMQLQHSNRGWRRASAGLRLQREGARGRRCCTWISRPWRSNSTKASRHALDGVVQPASRPPGRGVRAVRSGGDVQRHADHPGRSFFGAGPAGAPKAWPRASIQDTPRRRGV